ncbi:isocitrate dehydrogenase NAD regulatory subunit 1 [Musa troglodytarum]|uniref:Isocitrate dehydrogenase NAD regulatory subunit 1 n=1 Tax=Musa troglodytarum TaxID=320322 RepID=A0A9E7GC14_9LILI|nr:isocitrate dehydrogenase NAD regulatory subunit 1 [Musa troglodytarum]
MPTCRKQSRNNFETGWMASSTVSKERLCDRQHSNSSLVAGGLVSPRTSTRGEGGGEIATKSFHLRRELPAAAAVITKFCSERIAKYAFEYAYLNNRKKVTAVHKANIMKLADGHTKSLWQSGGKHSCRHCRRHCVMPGGNVGQDHAVFEQGASAGNVGNEKIMEQKKANPVALLLSSAMMLRHLRFPSFADRLETAVKRVIAEGKYRTKDLGGSSTTQEVVHAVIAKLD